MADLFDECRAADMARLKALGWKLIDYFGQDYWRHPTHNTWHTVDQALKWLRQHDAGQEERQG